VSPLEAGVYKITVRRRDSAPWSDLACLGGSAGGRGRFRAPGGSIFETSPWKECHRRSTARTRPETAFEHDEIARLPLNAGPVAAFRYAPTPMSRPPRAAKPGNSPRRAAAQHELLHVDGVSATTCNRWRHSGAIDGGTCAGKRVRQPGFADLSRSGGRVFHSHLQHRRRNGRLPERRSPSPANPARIFGTARSTTDGAMKFWRPTIGSPTRQPGRGAARLNEISQTLGGPVRANRTFVFLSFQHLGLTQPYVWNQPVPSLDARQTAAHGAGGAGHLPVPNQGLLTAGIGIGRAAPSNRRL